MKDKKNANIREPCSNFVLHLHDVPTHSRHC